MKVSLALSKFYGNHDFTQQSIDTIVEKIGSQLGAVEGVEDLGAKYQGVIVAKIISCVDHPNADRLHVCKIDDGGMVSDVSRDENGYIQVVCGAPNVREGMTVAWLPPGSTVPESFNSEPFVLEARDLRGEMSNGMLASPKELAISDNHEGILNIDEIIDPGTPFAAAFNLNDHLIDIENKMFTHRPDCFGLLGVYREIAGIQHEKFVSPIWYNPGGKYDLASEADELPLVIHNEIPSLVPRFMAATMSDIEVKPSPIWLQIHLMRAGVRPINNIVDITNFVMYVTGQPLHAYDYDKVRKLSDNDRASLHVRYPRNDEKVQLLNGKEVNPRDEAIVIATDQKLIGIGGVMGGSETEVDEHTTRIILEVATFDMYSIRRTSMAHGLFTDAVTRFNKGQSPLQNANVLAKAIHEVRSLAGGKLAGDVHDNNHTSENNEQRIWVHPPVPVSAPFINSRLGLQLSVDEMKMLLENVEFSVEIENDNLTVQSPFWRTDVETREDVVEEVGRLYGFDTLPMNLPLHDLSPTDKNPSLELKNQIRTSLAKAGANEVLTYSFVHGDLLDKVGQRREDAFSLSNALSPELQYYRLGVLPSLLEKVHPNIKSGYDTFALFEIGKGHNLSHKDDDHGLPSEFDLLDFVFAANDKAKGLGAPFYKARKFVVALADDLGITLHFSAITEDPMVPASAPYNYKRAAFITTESGDFLGMVGEFKPSVIKNMKLPSHSAGFGIGLRQLQEACDKTRKTYVPIPRFPKIEQDICYKVSVDVAYADLFSYITKELIELLSSTKTNFTVGPVDIYQREDDREHKQITLRFSIVSYEKTMTDTEVSNLLDQISQKVQEKFKAERV